MAFRRRFIRRAYRRPYGGLISRRRCFYGRVGAYKAGRRACNKRKTYSVTTNSGPNGIPTLTVKPKAGYMVLHNDAKTKVVKMSSPSAIRGYYAQSGAPGRAWDNHLVNVLAYANAAAGDLALAAGH